MVFVWELHHTTLCMYAHGDVKKIFDVRNFCIYCFPMQQVHFTFITVHNHLGF